jgi:hypothetical protein
MASFWKMLPRSDTSPRPPQMLAVQQRRARLFEGSLGGGEESERLLEERVRLTPFRQQRLRAGHERTGLGRAAPIDRWQARKPFSGQLRTPSPHCTLDHVRDDRQGDPCLGVRVEGPQRLQVLDRLLRVTPGQC